MPLAPQAFDLQLHHVSGFEVAGRLHTQAHPRRGAGGDQVAGFQGHELGEVVHQIVAPEDHGLRIALLHRPPVDRQPHLQVLRVSNLVGRGQPGAQGVEGVARLPLGPLPAPFELEGPRDLAIARDALAATRTLDFEDRSFDTLSGGEKQRVVIAGALAQLDRRAENGGQTAADWSDGLLLLDEPTASLDIGYQLDIAALLKQLWHERRVTILISTHDLNLAAGVCRDLVLLKEGRVLAAGPTEAVLTTENIRALYGVEAEVRQHEAAGHLTVVPIGRVGAGRPRGGGGTRP